ncbi:MAG TPA: hypothetical protein V6D47_20465 [Oscillatoriaceae cyanobacterium]
MRRGMSLVEVLIAASVLVTVLLAMGLYQTATVRMNQNQRDRAFAVQKATQMMEEIVALQTQKTQLTPQDVATFADGASRYNFKLTIDPNVGHPEDSLSGNTPQGASYRFVRQIVVLPLDSDDKSSQVTIKVFLADTTNKSAAPKPNTKALSVVTNVIRATPPQTVPTDVYDIFLVDIGNAINSWADPETIRTAINNAVGALEGENTGLEFRLHWVTRLGSGRDAYYMPYDNNRNDRTSLANWAYAYPGSRDPSNQLSPPAASGTAYFFDPSLMSNSSLGVGGQRMEDGRGTDLVESTAWTRGGRGSSSQLYVDDSNFAWADQFNNALRYPEEYTKWYNAGEDLDDIPLDLLLEFMAEGQLKNAIVVNVNGSVLPIPPVRNYSDAARVPDDTNSGWHSGYDDLQRHWGLNVGHSSTIDDGSRARLVTHPLDMHVAVATGSTYSEAETVNLGVYPYLSSNQGTDLDATDGSDFHAGYNPYHSARILLRGVKNNLYTWDSGQPQEKQVEIDVLPDDYDTGNVAPYQWVRAWPNNHGASFSMGSNPYSPNVADNAVDSAHGHYIDGDPDWSGNDLRIKLKNLPYCHKPLAGRGMDPNVLLDGFNYFPDPALPSLSATYAAGAPRNTARVRILFKATSALQSGHGYQPLTITTTIGQPDHENIDGIEEPNRSDTYVWIGSDKVPAIEQFQYMGDPRENPYKDVRAATGYNRYFGDFSSNPYGSQTPAGVSFSSTAAGYGTTGHKTSVDLPAFMELWRDALLGANAVFVNAEGQAFTYFTLGGEILENVPQALFNSGGSTSLSTLDEFNGHRTLVSNGSWYATPWLGELWPDNQWGNWLAYGNLKTSDGYKRYSYAGGPLTLPASFDAPQPGTSLLYDRNGSLGAADSNSYGPAEFFLGGTTTSDWAAVEPNGGDGASATSPYCDNWNATFNMSLSSSYLGEYPFFLDSTDANAKPPDWAATRFTHNGLEWGVFYDETAAALSPGGYYYDSASSSSGNSVAPIVIKRPATSPTSLGYVVLNTLDANLDPGAPNAMTDMVQMALTEGVQGLLDMADPKFSDNATAKPTSQVIRLQPLVNASAPVANTTVSGGSTTVTWTYGWTRWDGNFFSNAFADADYTSFESEPVFNLKYSQDNGNSWNFINDDHQAYAGYYDSTEEVNSTIGGATYAAGPPASYSKTWTFPGHMGHSLVLRIECFRSQANCQQVNYSYVDVPFKH